MKSRSAPSDQLIKDIKGWKKAQAIITLSLDEMKNVAKGQKVISEQKVDGQSAILGYEQGEAEFGSLHGMIMTEMPALEEIQKILKSKKITQAKMVGEMAGYDKGKIIPFNESESLIKNPKADKNKIHWFPYQIIELNGKKIGSDYETYTKMWPELTNIFRGSKYVHPVEKYEGGMEIIDKSYKKLVEKDKNEGIVVRLSNNKVYKVKPRMTYDLAVIAFGDKTGKNWPKKMIGTTLMAFMDNNKVFRTAGEVGTGWTQAERRELFTWAQKNKVGEDDHYVWVKPKIIYEIKWERTTIKNMPSFEFKNNKYIIKEKLRSATIVKPIFIRNRKDKSVDPYDLRLTQIPDWNKKMAFKIITKIVKLSLYPIE